MTKLLIVFVLIVLGIGALMPVTAMAARQGFRHPDKGWARPAVYLAARLRMRSGQYQRAAAILEPALQLWPTGDLAADTHFWLGLCYERSGNPQVAMRWYRAFLARYPGHRWSLQAERRVATLEAESSVEDGSRFGRRPRFGIAAVRPSERVQGVSGLG